MSKKNYQKPKAEYIAFYSDREIATALPISDYDDPTVDIGPGTSGFGTGTGNPDWED